MKERKILLFECKEYGLNIKNGAFIAFCVPAITALYFLLIAFPGSRGFAVRIAQENNPIELATFSLFLASSVLALYNAYCFWKTQNLVLVSLVYVFMFIFLFVIAMEEIAWGQQFFSFSTPDLIKSYNAQHELTIHNLNGIQGNAAKLYMALCIIIIAGMFLRTDGRYSRVFKAIQTPKILLPGLVVVLLASLPKLYTELFYVHNYYEHYIRWTTEVIELTIGLLALFYMILKRKLAAPHKRSIASNLPTSGNPLH